MPVPQLVPLTIQAPGFRGLNTQEAAAGLTSDWATTADNCVFDDFGRVAARNGFSKVTTALNANKPTTGGLFQYVKSDTVDSLVHCDSDGIIWEGDETLTDITGAISFTSAQVFWKFQNFNTRVVGWQEALKPIYYTGSSTFLLIQTLHSDWVANTAYSVGDTVKKTSAGFQDYYYVCESAGTSHATTEPTWTEVEGATYSDGTVTWRAVKIPDGNECVSAYGRVWATDSDKKTVKYSALNQEHLFDTENGGGAIDLSLIWAHPQDEITALATFNNYLIVFSKYNITMYDNAHNVSSLSLKDQVVGIGCIARDSVQNIGSDLLFLSSGGVMSLSRTVEIEKVPMIDLTVKVRDDLNASVSQVAAGVIKSVYSAKEGFYILSTGGTQYVLDLKHFLQDVRDEENSIPLPRITKWSGMNPDSMCVAKDDTIYFGKLGLVGKYSGYTDYDYRPTAGTYTYLMEYKSGWLDLAETFPELLNRIKIGKNIRALIRGGAGYDITFLWNYDYVDSSSTTTVTSSGIDGSEFNVAEWGIAKWSGFDSINTVIGTPMTGYGQHLQYGFKVTINASAIAFQKIDLLIKVGRVAR